MTEALNGSSFSLKDSSARDVLQLIEEHNTTTIAVAQTRNASHRDIRFDIPTPSIGGCVRAPTMLRYGGRTGWARLMDRRRTLAELLAVCS